MKQNKRPSKNKANFIGHKKTIKMPYLHKSIFNHLITKKNLKRIIRSLNLHIITNYIKFETLISKYRKMKKDKIYENDLKYLLQGPCENASYVGQIVLTHAARNETLMTRIHLSCIYSHVLSCIVFQKNTAIFVSRKSDLRLRIYTD